MDQASAGTARNDRSGCRHHEEKRLPGSSGGGCPLLVTAHLVVGVRYRLGGCGGLIALLSLAVDVRYL